jgi:hypothetical protein
MESSTIPRTLWFETGDRRTQLQQSALLQRPECLIILGEAGMGKSTLLEWIASAPGHALCTARQLINRHSPETLLKDAGVLVIDALDEVSAKGEGDAVDLVLRKLGTLAYPRFVLSCRVADWRSATGLEAIREQYAASPLELHLDPISDAEIMAHLTQRVGPANAKLIVEHFNTRGLQGLLGNPQTLELVVTIGAGALPETRGELIERACDMMREEQRGSKIDRQPPRQVALDAAGAAFAALILTGSEAIVRSATADEAEGELALADIRHLPRGEVIDAVLDTRLFKADAADRFSYWHRRLGEYLGAQWLTNLADTPRKRRRVLSFFHAYGLVPANLRGIHAWLAQNPAFAADVIAADPMGVIEYGDADRMTVEQGRVLLQALQGLAEQNPRFRRWERYSLRGICKPELVEDISRLIASTETPFGLRLLVLEAINGSNIVSALAHKLRDLVLSPKEIFAHRSAAGEALAKLLGEDQWLSIIGQLRDFGDELSLRLAIELIDDVGYEQFDDNLIVDLIVRHAQRDSRTVGILFRMENALPDARLEGMLGRLVEALKTLPKSNNRSNEPRGRITDLAYKLLVRRVSLGGVEPTVLWAWLEPLDAEAGIQRETRKQLDGLIQRDTPLRRAIQRLIILEQSGEKDAWRRAMRLSRRSSALAPKNDDVVALLGKLDPRERQDERWRDIMQLVRHNGDEGADVRRAARPFAAHRPDLLKWIDDLAEPRVPEWQAKQAESERRRRGKRAAEWAEHRRNAAENIDALRRGDYGPVLKPAKAYLHLFSGMGDSLPAHERVAQWLGDELAEAAHEGFESFLTSPNPKPTADEIAESFANGKRWEASYILVAALAERLRTGRGFDDLNVERLMAGLFELRHTKIDNHAGIEGLEEALEAALRSRGSWEDAIRRLIEPQLSTQRAHVDGLYSLMKDDVEAELGTRLAFEWLQRFGDIPTSPQLEMIDRLLRSGRYDEVSKISASRNAFADDDQRRAWDAVGVIVDFEAVSARLNGREIEPDLIWQLRDRTGGRRGNDPAVALTPAQIEWMVSKFRTVWPNEGRPTDVTMGANNKWDASDFLAGLIRRLGNESGDDAVAALQHLQSAPVDGYTEAIKSVAAEQARIRVEAAYSPPALDAVDRVVRDRTPTNSADLQAFMLEEIRVVQKKVWSDDAESWRGFFENGQPRGEEASRDHLVGLLRQGCTGVDLSIETHVAGDREVDIVCVAGKLRLPIEIKGQWHRDLWTAADTQLAAFYSKDWQADGRGIYLVLWFGENVAKNKRLRKPEAGQPLPTGPADLEDLLRAGSKAVRDGLAQIVVLDLTRP